ncbi:MAG: hypothetical protein U0903_06545 [Planctomycetales bacterium]
MEVGNRLLADWHVSLRVCPADTPAAISSIPAEGFIKADENTALILEIKQLLRRRGRMDSLLIVGGRNRLTGIVRIDAQRLEMIRPLTIQQDFKVNEALVRCPS